MTDIDSQRNNNIIIELKNNDAIIEICIKKIHQTINSIH